MFEENKSLNHPALSSPSPLSGEGRGKVNKNIVMSYTKTNKLITALYMVTDIMDKDEPLRNNLRTLGAEIISDTSCLPKDLDRKISASISLLDIASTMNLISEMNCNILKREFFKFKGSLNISEEKALNLEELFNSPLEEYHDQGRGEVENFLVHPPRPLSTKSIPQEGNKGHHFTSIGVQKGSTLMKALSDINMSDINSDNKNFDNLRKNRRETIIKIIKDNGGIVGIKDITIALKDTGEKTLQRELISMIKDKILKKTGEKRWSKYSL